MEEEKKYHIGAFAKRFKQKGWQFVAAESKMLQWKEMEEVMQASKMWHAPDMFYGKNRLFIVSLSNRLVVSFDQLAFLFPPLMEYAGQSGSAAVEKGEGFERIVPKAKPAGGASDFQFLIHHDLNSKRILMATHPDIAKVSFTGSTEVGIQVAQAAAGSVKRVTLELGGKSPTIVDESANLVLAAQTLMWGKFINNGQSGGGIFQGNYLVGVMVEKNADVPGQPGTICTAVPLPVIVDALAQCGPGGCSPGNAAGGFLPRPNRPLGTPPIGGGQIPPAAPRDDLPGPGEEPLVPVPSKPAAPANSDRLDKIDAMLEELVDRFGKLPAQAQTLFDLHRLRVQAGATQPLPGLAGSALHHADKA
mgnify:CR=1 FL=1